MVKELTTQMRRFHDWYMKKPKERELLGVRIKDEDYFNGTEEMWLDMRDIYEIYHLGPLNIALVSCWVL